MPHDGKRIPVDIDLGIAVEDHLGKSVGRQGYRDRRIAVDLDVERGGCREAHTRGRRSYPRIGEGAVQVAE